MPKFYNHINLLIMPTDACNMNCVYCFHKPYSTNFDRMSVDTIKRIFDITAPYYETINVIWHGGEPLLMGLEFYKNILALQKKYNCKFINSIQSNLTLLTSEIADFLAENNIDISGSFDGVCNEELRGNSEKILSCRQLMIDRGKRCGFIMVVSGYNIDRLIESYNFFKSINVNFSLNLYVDQKGNPQEKMQLQEEHTIQRLTELFDYWAKDVNGNIYISYFQNILEFILEGKKSLCSYTSCLGRWLGIHYDGTLGPCNRYFPKEYMFGNVYDYMNIGDAFNSDGFKKLLQEAIERRNKCKKCEINNFCNGGCNNVSLNENGISNNNGLTCKILRGVYYYIYDYICNAITACDYTELNPQFVKLLQKYN